MGTIKATGYYTHGYIPCHGKQRVDSLPSDVENVIINGKTVVVTLVNGKKGVAKCGFKDEFDPYIGFCISLQKARTTNNFKLKNTLNDCIESAKKKGYSQAILKNYDNEKTMKKQIEETYNRYLSPSTTFNLLASS